MSTKRKATRQAAPSTTEALQERINGLLEWLAEHDPIKAARLVGEYLDDLAEEMGPKARKSLS